MTAIFIRKGMCHIIVSRRTMLAIFNKAIAGFHTSYLLKIDREHRIWNVRFVHGTFTDRQKIALIRKWVPDLSMKNSLSPPMTFGWTQVYVGSCVMALQKDDWALKSYSWRGNGTDALYAVINNDTDVSPRVVGGRMMSLATLCCQVN